jgi:hypothetical protein
VALPAPAPIPVTIDKAKVSVTDLCLTWASAFDIVWKLTIASMVFGLIFFVIASILKAIVQNYS